MLLATAETGPALKSRERTVTTFTYPDELCLCHIEDEFSGKDTPNSLFSAPPPPKRLLGKPSQSESRRHLKSKLCRQAATYTPFPLVVARMTAECVIL